MKKKLKDYIKDIENNKIDPEDILTWINFFQHERLVHLIVTFLTGIGMVLFFLGSLLLENILIFVLFILTLCLFIPYIFHYYYLENGVQRLYDLYFEKKKNYKK